VCWLNTAFQHKLIVKLDTAKVIKNPHARLKAYPFTKLLSTHMVAFRRSTRAVKPAHAQHGWN